MNELEKVLAQINGIIDQINEINQDLREERERQGGNMSKKTCRDCKLHDQCAEYASEDDWEGSADDCFDFKPGGYCLEEDVMLLAKEPV